MLLSKNVFREEAAMKNIVMWRHLLSCNMKSLSFLSLISISSIIFSAPVFAEDIKDRENGQVGNLTLKISDYPNPIELSEEVLQTQALQHQDLESTLIQVDKTVSDISLASDSIPSVQPGQLSQEVASSFLTDLDIDGEVYINDLSEDFVDITVRNTTVTEGDLLQREEINQISPQITEPDSTESELVETEPELVEIEQSVPHSTVLETDIKIGGEIFDPIAEAEGKSEEIPAEIIPFDRLTDVAPNDWGFQALQNLAEQYGCLSGYPDQTFRGEQVLTRREFAVALSACTSGIDEQIGAQGLESVAQTDLQTLQRLREDFTEELLVLDERILALEERVNNLQENSLQGLRLNGLVWFDLNAASFSGDLKRETGARVAPGSQERVIENAEQPEPIASTYAWLELSKSFTGEDLLLLQLAVGDGFPILNDSVVSAGLEYTYGANFTNQAGGVVPREVVIRELFYDFPVGNDLRVTLAPRINVFRTFDYSKYSYVFYDNGAPPAFNYLTFNSANSTLFNAFDRGTGVVIDWDINPQLELKAAYLAENNEFLPSSLFNTATDPSEGLFGGTNSLTAELTYTPSPRARIRLLYNRSNLRAFNGLIGPGGVAEPVGGLVDDGFGGAVGDATADMFSIGFDWDITPGIGLFGRYSYGSLNVSPLDPARNDGEINVQSYQLGLAFPNLLKNGDIATLSFVVPYDYLDGREFLVSGGGDGGTQFETELAYYLPLTDNISLLPSIYMISNPNNFSDNPDLFVFNLRTQFSF